MWYMYVLVCVCSMCLYGVCLVYLNVVCGMFVCSVYVGLDVCMWCVCWYMWSVCQVVMHGMRIVCVGYVCVVCLWGGWRCGVCV